MSLALRYAARSDVGLLRDGNEDSGYAGPALLAVADGMGGHVGGEIASAVAVAALVPLDTGRPSGRGAGDGEEPGRVLLDRLSAAVLEANEHLRRMAEREPGLEGMGTTLTALLCDGAHLGLAHVGDSRCYRLRDGALAQVTRDHTLVQSLVDEGQITREQAERHPQRSLLTRALDGRAGIEVDLLALDGRAGDRYLLCSDGLSGVVSDETLARTLAGTPDPDDACEALLDLALRAGGPDNITCVVADVVDAATLPRHAKVTRLVVGSAQRAVRLTPPEATPPEASRPEATRTGTTRTGTPRTEATRTGATRTEATRTEAPVGGGAPVAPADATSAGAAAPARDSRRRRPGRVLLVLSVLLVLFAGGTYAAYSWSQRQYFVGADEGNVAIYRGLDPEVAGSLLATRLERQELPLDALPPVARQRVADTIAAEDLEHARSIVGRLEAQAASCAAPAAPPATPLGSPPAPAVASLPAAVPTGAPCEEVPR